MKKDIDIKGAPRWAKPLDPKERARYRMAKSETKRGTPNFKAYDVYYGDWRIAGAYRIDGKFQANLQNGCRCFTQTGRPFAEQKELFFRWHSRNELARYAKHMNIALRQLRLSADTKTPISHLPPADGSAPAMPNPAFKLARRPKKA